MSPWKSSVARQHILLLRFFWMRATLVLKSTCGVLVSAYMLCSSARCLSRHPLCQSCRTWSSEENMTLSSKPMLIQSKWTIRRQQLRYYLRMSKTSFGNFCRRTQTSDFLLLRRWIIRGFSKATPTSMCTQRRRNNWYSVTTCASTSSLDSTMETIIASRALTKAQHRVK